MADASARNVVTSPQSGYPKEIFSSDVDKKFLCNHCQLILREPVQSYCGHRFCRACIEGVISHGDSVRCSSCVREDNVDEPYSLLKLDQMFPDNGLKREMATKPCKCVNQGCNWKGTFQEYEKNHVDKCQFKPRGCELCGAPVESVKMPHHEKNECPNRKIKCKFCGEEMIAHNETDHKNQCAKAPLQCSACNKKKILREQMQHHIQNECPNQRIKCPVCNQEVAASQFSQHIKQKKDQHTSWMFVQLGQVQQMVENSPSPVPATQDARVIANQITELERKVQEQEQQIQTLTSQATGGGARLKDSDLQPVRTSIATLELKTGTFEGIATTLKKEIERCLVQIETVDRQRREDREMQENNEQKVRSVDRTLQLKDIAIAEQDLRLQALEQVSYNGVLMWRIADFTRHRTEALQRGKYVSSPSFYTSRTGYKMCTRLYPTGDGMGKGSHISLFFVIMKGPNDALLQWPFQHKVSFLLIDQSGANHVEDGFMPDMSSTSFKRPTSDMNIASGCPMFLSLTRLDDPGSAYIKDDTMFIKVSVDTTTGNTQHAFMHSAGAMI